MIQHAGGLVCKSNSEVSNYFDISVRYSRVFNVILFSHLNNARLYIVFTAQFIFIKKYFASYFRVIVPVYVYIYTIHALFSQFLYNFKYIRGLLAVIRSVYY